MFIMYYKIFLLLRCIYEYFPSLISVTQIQTFIQLEEDLAEEEEHVK